MKHEPASDLESTEHDTYWNGPYISYTSWWILISVNNKVLPKIPIQLKNNKHWCSAPRLISHWASAAKSGKSTTLVGRARRSSKAILQGMSCSFRLPEMQRMNCATNCQTLTDDEMKRVITGTYHSIMSRFTRAKNNWSEVKSKLFNCGRIINRFYIVDYSKMLTNIPNYFSGY